MQSTEHAPDRAPPPSRKLTIGDMRWCAVRDYQDGVMGLSLRESAANTLQRIDLLNLWPRDEREWETNWGEFVCMLNDLVEPPPATPASLQSSPETQPHYAKAPDLEPAWRAA